MHTPAHVQGSLKAGVPHRQETFLRPDVPA